MPDGREGFVLVKEKSAVGRHRVGKSGRGDDRKTERRQLRRGGRDVREGTQGKK